MIENFFVCVGAQKSGTTWLARTLAAHPDLFLTPVKEIHYFDHVRGLTEHLGPRKRRSRYRKYHQRLWTQWGRIAENRALWPWYRDYMADPIDDRWYARLFEHRGDCRFAGEVTPEYAIIGEDGFRHLQRLAPGARLLFIMRSPVAQSWSQVLHFARGHDIDIAHLSTQRLIELTELVRVRALRDYAQTLADLAAVFPPSQVMPLFFEDVHADRPEALRGICRFIGIDDDRRWFPDTAQRFNSSQEAALPAPVREHLRRQCRPVAEAVQARLGRIPDGWLRDLE